MDLFRIDGRLQCVSIAVSFTGPDNEQYLILGRGDPRHYAFDGSCLDGKTVQVGGWKFPGGFAENVDNAKPLSFTPDSLGIPVPDTIWHSGLKELEEELGISQEHFAQVEALQGVWDKAKYRLLYQQPINATSPLDLHCLSLDLGKLTEAQFAALKNVVAPHDDMIQTIIAPCSVLHRNGGKMMLSVTDGHCKTNEDFTGFKDLEEWRRFYQEGQNGGHGDFFSTRTPDAIGQRFAYMERIHREIHGLDGIDIGSLNTKEPLGFAFDNDRMIEDHFLPALSVRGVHSEGHLNDGKAASIKRGGRNN